MELRFGSTRLWILGLLVALAGLAWLVAEPARANLPISGGQLYAFGLNNFGQLGDTNNNGTATPNPNPTLVTLPGATGPVVDVAVGGGHSLVSTSTGRLYTFGYNDSGQLGTTTNGGTPDPNPTPTLVTLPGATGPVFQVAAGMSHSLALTTTGQLYAFGNNQYGELGVGTNSGTRTPNPTPMLVTLPGATGPVVRVAAGGQHSLAVTSTGQLYAFGDNQSGQLGSTTNNGTDNQNPTPTLVTLPGGSRIAAIALGQNADDSVVAVVDLAVTPALSGMRVSPHTTSTGGRLVKGHCVAPTPRNSAHRQCTKPVKHRITFDLIGAGDVTLSLQRIASGRVVGHRCVAPTRRRPPRSPSPASRDRRLPASG